MRQHTLNGGESGDWVRFLDPEATQPILEPRHVSDDEITQAVNRINPDEPELGAGFLATSLLYT